MVYILYLIVIRLLLFNIIIHTEFISIWEFILYVCHRHVTLDIRIYNLFNFSPLLEQIALMS
jgi:hypothetical protein